MKLTAEDVMRARRDQGLPTKMKVRHEKYGECIVWAFVRVQAEMAACLNWKCSWQEEQGWLHISVMRDQTGYEEACRI